MNDPQPSLKENELSSFDYEPSKKSRFKWFVLGFFLLIFAILFNISWEDQLDALLHKQLDNPQCPISYEKLELQFLTLHLKNITVSGKCFGRPDKYLIINSAQAKLKGLSPFPPSLSTRVEAHLEASVINALIKITPSNTTIDIENSRLEPSDILPAVLPELKLKGKIIIDAQISLKDNIAEDGILFAKSDSLLMDAQNIAGLQIPAIPLGNLALKARINGGTRIKLESFILGGEISPVRINLNGSLLMDQKSFANSRLDLQGELGLDQNLIEQISILQLVLNQFPQQNGLYQIKLSGTVANPLPIGQ
ncbi:MAG: type II secretion system protein GspN [Bacteriovoracaceae bacterium]|nr:type II secretion system protein GspN [Bacteriovoracaceae bacterium]